MDWGTQLVAVFGSAIALALGLKTVRYFLSHALSTNDDGI